MNDSLKLVKEIDSFFFTNFHLFVMHILASTLGRDCTLALPHYIHVYTSLPFIHLNENIFYIFDILSIINKAKRFKTISAQRSSSKCKN